jgi:hypothetical protein
MGPIRESLLDNTALIRAIEKNRRRSNMHVWQANFRDENDRPEHKYCVTQERDVSKAAELLHLLGDPTVLYYLGKVHGFERPPQPVPTPDDIQKLRDEVDKEHAAANEWCFRAEQNARKASRLEAELAEAKKQENECRQWAAGAVKDALEGEKRAEKRADLLEWQLRQERENSSKLIHQLESTTWHSGRRRGYD